MAHGVYYRLAAVYAWTRPAMLRKVLWSALSGVLGALAAIVSRRSAATIWRTLTGEEPPTKR
jgi:demethoxyubiquinone hydroxylase (CLK1/Coq7/Cat5 family)